MENIDKSIKNIDKSIKTYKACLNITNIILISNIIIISLPTLFLLAGGISLSNGIYVMYILYLLCPTITIQIVLLVKAYLCKRKILKDGGNSYYLGKALILMQLLCIVALLIIVSTIVTIEEAWIIMWVTFFLYPFVILVPLGMFVFKIASYSMKEIGLIGKKIIYR